VFLVNARLSDRSHRGYKKFGFSVPARCSRPLPASARRTKEDAARLREVGCRPEAIRVVGNLKFDAAKMDERRLDVPALLRSSACRRTRRFLVGGSTHDGEEIALAENRATAAGAFPEAFSGAGAAAF
jgi:3-deoxy-D-manno-octulosonic-acid transferase